MKRRKSTPQLIYAPWRRVQLDSVGEASENNKHESSNKYWAKQGWQIGCEGRKQERPWTFANAGNMYMSHLLRIMSREFAHVNHNALHYSCVGDDKSAILAVVQRFHSRMVPWWSELSRVGRAALFWDCMGCCETQTIAGVSLFDWVCSVGLCYWVMHREVPPLTFSENVRT